jgi:hypothetical protein
MSTTIVSKNIINAIPDTVQPTVRYTAGGYVRNQPTKWKVRVDGEKIMRRVYVTQDSNCPTYHINHPEGRVYVSYENIMDAWKKTSY